MSDFEVRSVTKVEIQIPKETVMAWLRTKFPEFGADAELTAASSWIRTIKFTVEHTPGLTPELLAESQPTGRA